MVKDVVGELGGREEEACFSGGGGTSSAGPDVAVVGSGVEGNKTEAADVVVTCNPLGIMLVVSRGRC